MAVSESKFTVRLAGNLRCQLEAMHEGEVIIELSGKDKENATVDDLLAQFAKFKGTALPDRTMLS